ncbi:hypothetical protein GA0115255_124872 [Streptomyces sp. Ncost-T6T-2b]|nr:hypothetical protein GA0115255_124872 [Streptomyces sp. Ncost-T6T-2b]
MRTKPTAGAPRNRPVWSAALMGPEAALVIHRCAERQEPPYLLAISMCSRLIPAAPSASDCSAQGSVRGRGRRLS